MARVAAKAQPAGREGRTREGKCEEGCFRFRFRSPFRSRARASSQQTRAPPPYSQPGRRSYRPGRRGCRRDAEWGLEKRRKLRHGVREERERERERREPPDRSARVLWENSRGYSAAARGCAGGRDYRVLEERYNRGYVCKVGEWIVWIICREDVRVEVWYLNFGNSVGFVVWVIANLYFTAVGHTFSWYIGNVSIISFPV